MLPGSVTMRPLASCRTEASCGGHAFATRQSRRGELGGPVRLDLAFRLEALALRLGRLLGVFRCLAARLELRAGLLELHRRLVALRLSPGGCILFGRRPFRGEPGLQVQPGLFPLSRGGFLRRQTVFRGAPVCRGAGLGFGGAPLRVRAGARLQSRDLGVPNGQLPLALALGFAAERLLRATGLRAVLGLTGLAFRQTSPVHGGCRILPLVPRVLRDPEVRQRRVVLARRDLVRVRILGVLEGQPRLRDLAGRRTGRAGRGDGQDGDRKEPRDLLHLDTSRLRIPGLLPELAGLRLELVRLPAKARGFALHPFRVGLGLRGRGVSARLFQPPAGSFSVAARRGRPALVPRSLSFREQIGGAFPCPGALGAADRGFRVGEKRGSDGRSARCACRQKRGGQQKQGSSPHGNLLRIERKRQALVGLYRNPDATDSGGAVRANG